MFERSWFWLRDRILALLATPPVLAVRTDKTLKLIPATRIQWALHPPDRED